MQANFLSVIHSYTLLYILDQHDKATKSRNALRRNVIF